MVPIVFMSVSRDNVEVGLPLLGRDHVVELNCPVERFGLVPVTPDNLRRASGAMNREMTQGLVAQSVVARIVVSRGETLIPHLPSAFLVLRKLKDLVAFLDEIVGYGVRTEVGGLEQPSLRFAAETGIRAGAPRDQMGEADAGRQGAAVYRSAEHPSALQS